MQLLDALLAFVLTMLALASIATLLVEVLHRGLLLRARGLLDMVQHIHDQEIQPWIKKRSEELGEQIKDGSTRGWINKCSGQSTEDQAEAQREFCKQLLANPIAKPRNLTSRWLTTPLLSIEEMSGKDFLRRLGQTDAGKVLLAQITNQPGEDADEAKKKADEAKDELNRWAEMFEAYGAAASDYFARRAKIFSIIAGISVAFIGNVSAPRILNSYLKDPAAAQRVIAKSSEFQQEWEKTEAQLKQAQATLSQQDASKESAEDIEAGLNRVVASLDSLGGEGIAIGYDRYRDGWSETPRSRGFLSWFLTVLLTGSLIGLGGPFWFNIVLRLSALRQALSGASPAATPDTGTTQESVTAENQVALLKEPLVRSKSQSGF